MYLSQNYKFNVNNSYPSNEHVKANISNVQVTNRYTNHAKKVIY